MSTLIFSDTHLTEKFEEAKFNYLKKIISDAKQVIINGDFWEGFLISFMEFRRSKWRGLFPILKKKNAIYIYGNHDTKKFNHPKHVHDFSVKQTDQHVIKLGDKNLIIEHGHRLAPTESSLIDVKNESFKSGVRMLQNFEKILVKTLGVHYQKLLFFGNKRVKMAIKKQKFNKNAIFITGHTHCQEFNLENNYINTGIIRHGLAQYLILEKDRIRIVKERYD